jgi:hypothetical protein
MSFAMALQPMDWQYAPRLTAWNRLNITASYVLFFAGPLIASCWLADRFRKNWTNRSPIRFVIVVIVMWIAGLILPVLFVLLLEAILN